VVIAAVALLAIPIGWHLRPSVIWHFWISPRLHDQGHSALLHQKSLSSFRSPSPGWPRLAVDNLSISAPILRDQSHLCKACSDRCLLEIDGGTLAIFGEAPLESYGEVLDLFAPDESDISIFRSAGRNWRSIRALTNRVANGENLPDAFRFLTSESKGIVSSIPRGELNRLVVYAYSHSGNPTRVIGLTGSDIGNLHRILGSLKVEPARAKGAGHPMMSDCS